MLNIKVADVLITINGDINQFFIDRTKEYAVNNADQSENNAVAPARDAVAPANNEKIDINFKYASHIKKPNGKIIATDIDRSWYVDDNADYAYYDINLQTGNVLSDTKIKNNNIDITMYDFHDSPDTVLTYPLLNSTDCAVNICLRSFDCFTLHASAIELDGYGLAFSAVSGTGKSTHTSLWQKSHPVVRMINDDSPIVHFENNKPYIYGSPWAGSTGINNNIKVPLKALIFLEQAPENSIQRADPLTALKKILTNTSIPMQKELAEKAYSLIDKLITETSCYILKCTPDQRAVDVVKRGLGLGN